jgi:hypothetical protein
MSAMTEMGDRPEVAISYPPEPGDARAERPSRWPLGLLVVVNLSPVVGVVAGALTLADVFLVYWFENVIVGVTTLVRAVTARHVATPGGQSSMRVSVGVRAQRLSEMDPATARTTLAVFFCFHYGIFTIGHGIVTLTLIGRADGFGDLSAAPITGGVLALAASHGFSLWWNWFRGGERDKNSVEDVVVAPYARIVVMHLAVLLGFAVLSGTAGAGNAVGPVVVLCTLKTALDAVLHTRQHHRLAHP